MTVQHDLEPLSPERAKEMYEQEREGEVAERTLQAHHYRLVHFIRWSKQEDIDDMNDLTGRKLHEYRLWRKEDGDPFPASLRTQSEPLRVSITFCETIDAVLSESYDKILLPTHSKEDEQREGILQTERAEEVLSHLRRFEYVSGPTLSSNYSGTLGSGREHSMRLMSTTTTAKRDVSKSVTGQMLGRR